ncbi:hypothetical protein Glove_30g75 [Diversispora epigaea]|uniref:Uncharacterized protein n=1 Tax=Diversispora epigaea TaxID=1348612 RepID=A0A397JKI3_9GLOM|nr:hypothetical protein Glove_30g75 [Diversispora epigaea]
MSLAVLEDEAYMFIDENSNAITYAVGQSKTRTMLHRIIRISFVNTIVTIGAYVIMELKSRIIKSNSEEMGKERLVTVGAGMVAPWVVKEEQYKNIRLALEIYCMLAIILVKIAWWEQQYVHGGAIDPKNYRGIEGAIYILSGLASLYVVVDLYD